jgi:hypothetical protein
MAHQAEAERDRRARVIAADGEFQASARLADAARAMGAPSGALQLRLLQTVSEVASDQNSTRAASYCSSASIAAERRSWVAVSCTCSSSITVVISFRDRHPGWLAE